MKILNRQEFIAEFNIIMRNHGKDCADPDHIIWEAEKYITPPHKCQWFVCVTPLDVDRNISNYWEWVKETLNEVVVCFSTDPAEQAEWWGFTDEQDAVIWTLKWAK